MTGRQWTVVLWEDEPNQVHSAWKGAAPDAATAIASARALIDVAFRIRTGSPLDATGLRPAADEVAFHGFTGDGQVEFSRGAIRALDGATGPEIDHPRRLALCEAAIRIAVATGSVGPCRLSAPAGAVLDNRERGRKVSEIHRPVIDIRGDGDAAYVPIPMALRAALLSASVPHAADTGHYARLEVPASASGRAAQRAEFLRRLDEDVALTAAHMESCRLGPEVEALRAMAAR